MNIKSPSVIKVFYTLKSVAIDYLIHDRPDIDLRTIKLLKAVHNWEDCYVLTTDSGDVDQLTDSDRQHIEAKRESNPHFED